MKYRPESLDIAADVDVPGAKQCTCFAAAVNVQGIPVSEMKLRMRKWRNVGTIDIVTVRIPPKTSAQVLAYIKTLVRATRLRFIKAS